MAVTPHQLAVGLQVPQCGRHLAEVFAEVGSIEMGVGVGGIELRRGVVHV